MRERSPRPVAATRPDTTLPAVLAAMLAVFATLVWASAALAEESAAEQARPATVVSTALAMREVLQPEVWIPGTVVSRADSAVAAEVAGRLLSVREVGDRVERGDVLGEINDEALQIQLRDDDARIARLETQIGWLGRQEERFRTLALSQSTAASELDRLGMERSMAQHELRAAEAQRDQTLHAIERSRVRAPFAGVVVSRAREPGEYIRAGDALLRLVNDADLEARVTAPIAMLRHVQPGDVVPVALDGETTPVQASVRAVIPVGDARTRTAELRLALTGTEPQPGSRWISGEAVRAALPGGAARATVTVPRDALVLRDGQVWLYRITAEGTAERLAVRTAEGTATHVAVDGLVRAGDRVVVRGAETLRDGQAVREVPLDAGAVAVR